MDEPLLYIFTTVTFQGTKQQIQSQSIIMWKLSCPDAECVISHSNINLS